MNDFEAIVVIVLVAMFLKPILRGIFGWCGESDYNRDRLGTSIRLKKWIRQIQGGRSTSSSLSTRIGFGIAWFKDSDIAPLFSKSSHSQRQ